MNRLDQLDNRLSEYEQSTNNTDINVVLNELNQIKATLNNVKLQRTSVYPTIQNRLSSS